MLWGKGLDRTINDYTIPSQLRLGVGGTEMQVGLSIIVKLELYR